MIVKCDFSGCILYDCECEMSVAEEFLTIFWSYSTQETANVLHLVFVELTYFSWVTSFGFCWTDLLFLGYFRSFSVHEEELLGFP